MNGDTLSGYAFAGQVRCERRGTQLLLAGADRTTGQLLQLVLAGVASAVLPASVQDLSVRVATAAGADMRRCVLEWRDGGVEVQARSVHVLHGADGPLAAAMPGISASWHGRLGWALLLNLVRIPGMTRLLQAIRGAD